MTHFYVVPGRVELVGKHVDYGGGRSLTCAIDLAVSAAARPLKQPLLRVRRSDTSEVVEAPINAGARNLLGAPEWATYVEAVARRIGRDFAPVGSGVEVELASTLPPASGLSSSTAVSTALARAVIDATGLLSHELFSEYVGTPLAFAEYVAAIETGSSHGPFAADEGVGVRGGAQDHVAIMCARDGMAGQFSYMPAREEGWSPWPAGQRLAIAVSGVSAPKAGTARAAYNRAADSMRWLVAEWNRISCRSDATLAAALASGPGAGDRIAVVARSARGSPADAAYLVRRLAQFREECEVIVPGVSAALRESALDRVGLLVDRSQIGAEMALENQIPETIHLARSARELGAAAASSFGAGFGGAVWAMFEGNRAEEFLAEWRRLYLEAFPRHSHGARFYLAQPGPPPSWLDQGMPRGATPQAPALS